MVQTGHYAPPTLPHITKQKELHPPYVGLQTAKENCTAAMHAIYILYHQH